MPCWVLKVCNFLQRMTFTSFLTGEEVGPCSLYYSSVNYLRRFLKLPRQVFLKIPAPATFFGRSGMPAIILSKEPSREIEIFAKDIHGKSINWTLTICLLWGPFLVIGANHHSKNIRICSVINCQGMNTEIYFYSLIIIIHAVFHVNVYCFKVHL